MYTLKGFCQAQLLIINQPGVDSAVGELSTKSKTYSREIGTYSSPAAPNIDLFTFSSGRTDVGKIEVPSVYLTTVLAINKFIVDRTISGQNPDNSSDFTVSVLGQFGGVVRDVQSGPMVLINASNYTPEWITYTIVDGIDGEEVVIKIWFSDSAFQQQYDEYEIVVVPPVDNLDDLFKNHSFVANLIGQLDHTTQQERIVTRRGVFPDTITKVPMYTWSNPNTPDLEIRTPWGVIIYGVAGNNVDNIKNALVDYALENSSYDRDEWIKYIPDLFKTTEHIIVPMWDNYSITNQTLIAGLLSPTVPVRLIIPLLKRFAPSYSEAHIEEHATASTFIYRSMSLLSIGNPENRDEVFDLKQRFPDYIVADSLHPDFARMSPKTQEWVFLLSKLIQLAENLTEFSILPVGLGRTMRDGVLYAVATFDDVQYLVVSQRSYMVDNPALI